MKVPLLDLQAQYTKIRTEVESAVLEVLQSQQFILGPQVKQCEAAVARYSTCAHGIGVSSGTDALLICLMAEGIGPGDEVITSPFTFFATVGAIARIGATPVFVDIDPTTYNLDAARVAAKISPRTRAIIPVHLYGQVADMDPLMDLARAHQLVVIEDAAQAIGAEYKGRRAGSIGHYGCFSFFPSKNLGAVGDAGMVVTNDAKRAELLACLRAHGAKPKYYHKLVGGNFRLDSIQAAVVSAKLPHLDGWTSARQRNAERFARLFHESGLDVVYSSKSTQRTSAEVVLPTVNANRHIFNQYVIRTPDRDGLKRALDAKGIGTEIYYPVPMHLQECFAYLGHVAGAFPESEAASLQTLALPIYPELTEEQARYVVDSVRGYLRSTAKAA
jgi:dTDP-4-amino-4,6-dideoxygalactose transaminase